MALLVHDMATLRAIYNSRAPKQRRADHIRSCVEVLWCQLEHCDAIASWIAATTNRLAGNRNYHSLELHRRRYSSGSMRSSKDRFTVRAGLLRPHCLVWRLCNSQPTSMLYHVFQVVFRACRNRTVGQRTMITYSLSTAIVIHDLNLGSFRPAIQTPFRPEEVHPSSCTFI